MPRIKKLAKSGFCEDIRVNGVNRVKFRVNGVNWVNLCLKPIRILECVKYYIRNIINESNKVLAQSINIPVDIVREFDLKGKSVKIGIRGNEIIIKPIIDESDNTSEQSKPTNDKEITENDYTIH